MTEPLDPSEVQITQTMEENLTMEEMAALERRCAQQHPEVILHCDFGKARTVYTSTGAHAECDRCDVGVWWWL